MIIICVFVDFVWLWVLRLCMAGCVAGDVCL